MSGAPDVCGRGRTASVGKLFQMCIELLGLRPICSHKTIYFQVEIQRFNNETPMFRQEFWVYAVGG
jgi:hypothetical protein